MLYSICQGYNEQSVLLELGKYFKGNQRIQRYTENTLHRRKIEMMNARLLVQQFTHPVHPNSSYRLSYLLRQFEDKMEKIRKIGSAEKIQDKREKQQARQCKDKHFSFSEK